MTLLATPDKEAARRTHAWLLLIGGLVFLIVASVFAVLSAKDERRVETTYQGGESSLATPGLGAEAGVSLLGAEDPVEAGAVLVCDQFRNGATVVQVASWFETQVETVGPEEEALFQAIVLHALTESCPEVVPGD